MGTDALTILLSLGALAVLLMFVGRVVAIVLKLALVVLAVWFLYAQVIPAVKERAPAVLDSPAVKALTSPSRD